MPGKGGRPKGARSNEEMSLMLTEAMSDVHKQVLLTRYWSERKKPVTDEEVERRIDDFFSYCERFGDWPLPGKLITALGISKNTFTEWRTNRHGNRPRRAEVIENAINRMYAIEEQLALEGKIQQAVWIFHCKNWYGLRDDPQVQITNISTNGDDMLTAEQIAAKYHFLPSHE